MIESGKRESACSGQRHAVAAAIFGFATLCAPPPGLAQTPYEAQIGGFMSAVLGTLITGEFAGRSPSNADSDLNRPICKFADYGDLRAAASDAAAFDAVHRRCKLTEPKIDTTHVHSTAHLPPGYCETLKTAFETVLADQVHGMQRNTGDLVIVDYKGSHYAATRRELARNAQLETRCQEDGSLRVSALRKRR